MKPTANAIKISQVNRRKLLQLKLDWEVKNVDEVITKLLKEAKIN